MTGNKRTWLLAGALALFAMALSLMSVAPAAHAERNPNPAVMKPGSEFRGESYTELATRWLQWAVSTPAGQNSFTDPDGRFCHVGQSGRVFFLGSNFGGESLRSCTVQVGEAEAFLATPGGYFCFLHLDGETEEALRACAEEGLIGQTTSVNLDGNQIKDLSRYKVTTPLIPFTLPEDPVIGLRPGQYEVVLVAFFVLFPHLSVGEHVIHLRDEFPDGFVSDVTYNLTIVPNGGKRDTGVRQSTSRR